MNFGTITEMPCVNAEPAVDVRCNDPAFALANPDICPIQPSLIIKPSIALACQLGSVRFKAFILENGKETDVSANTIFTSSDIGTAMVGARSGNATGISAGVASITARYQDKTARAEFNVLGCTGACDQTVAMLCLVDTSRSMSQTFSGTYGSKLAFARTAASEFAATINDQKDLVGAMKFNALDTTLLDSPTSDAPTVAADILAIAQTQQLTTFRDALDAAVAELNATTADLRVLVLFSDGEDTTSTYNDDNNPLIPAQAFKAAGGIIICMGIRAHDKGFNLLEAFSTGGFFINAYPTVADTAISYLKGLRGYICAGNCTPAGDEIVFQGVSNYTGFENWDVTQGNVDLLGNGFYDTLPGNGLYVDLRGSPSISGNYDIPILRSLDTFALTSGHNYRLALDLAGNQAVARPGDTVSIRVFSDAITVLAQQVSIPDYTQPFQTFAFNFTAPADMDVRIEISQNNDTGTDLSETQAGVLMDRVKLEDTTDIITLLDDDFDTENPTYVPPRCGIGSVFYSGGYATGTNCYGEGCLDEPPPVQLSDPQPLPDIESGFTPPVTFNSSKTVCETCGAQGMNLSETNLVPAMTGPTTPSGEASASDENPSFQAYGAFNGVIPTVSLTPNAVWQLAAPSYPVWLRYDFTEAQTVRHYEITAKNAYSGLNHPPTAWTFQGSNDGSTWDDLDTVIGATFFAGETKKYLVDSPAEYLYYRLNITAGSSVDVIVFELGMFEAVDQSVCRTASAESLISQSDADSQANAAASALAVAALNCTHVYSSTQQAQATCAYHTFAVTRSASAISLNSQDEADAEALRLAQALAEDALNCDQSTNGQQITIEDNAVADPYPSVKSVTGVTDPVTKVTVSITNLTHFFPVDIVMVLQGPTGQTCLLMANSGNAPAADVSFIFDDAGATIVPTAGPIVDGTTYKPGTGGAYAPLPAPGPAQPHGANLAVFNALDPNGLWALWILDDTGGNAGTLDSWDLTIV